VTFTSSSTVHNFVALLDSRRALAEVRALRGPGHPRIAFASIGPVTSSTLREVGLRADIVAKEFTIPGLVKAIVSAVSSNRK
jgi:uroporphyrinogen III methyltransferase/synthase